MKTIKFFFVLILNICSTHAQEIIQELEGHEIQNYEPIAENALQINNKIGYSSTTSEITTLYGMPSSISNQYWEMDDVTVKYYHYNGGIFIIRNGTLESFELTSSNWFVNTGFIQLKVGQHIDEIQYYYSDAYFNRGNGSIVIKIGIGDYKYLLIKYNSNNIINCIEQRYF